MADDLLAIAASWSFWERPVPDGVPRAVELPKALRDSLGLVVQGVRRCGKSTLLRQLVPMNGVLRSWLFGWLTVLTVTSCQCDSVDLAPFTPSVGDGGGATVPDVDLFRPRMAVTKAMVVNHRMLAPMRE